jgi:hypothetical protein
MPCYSYACNAQFNNTKFARLGGLPANFGQSYSCPCAYQRMKRSEAIHIFLQGAYRSAESSSSLFTKNAGDKRQTIDLSQSTYYSPAASSF